MITGFVNARREPVIRLMFQGADSLEINLEMAIDTGFSESISLPRSWIDALEMPFLTLDEVFLADGSLIKIPMYVCSVVWDGQARTVAAHCAEGVPLVGMKLMDDYLLTVDAKIGGMVTLMFNP